MIVMIITMSDVRKYSAPFHGHILTFFAMQNLKCSNYYNTFPSSKESYGTTYGDLELFLCGLDLSYLVDVVRGHQIDFNTFLRLTEEDLVKVILQ